VPKLAGIFLQKSIQKEIINEMVDFTNMFGQREQDEKLFLANGVRQIDLANFTLHNGQIS